MMNAGLKEYVNTNREILKGTNEQSPRNLRYSFRSDLAEIREHRVDQLEGLVDLFTDFSAGEDDLPADKDQKNNLRFHHTIDETRKQLRFIGAEVVMPAGQAFQTDGELDVARAYDVLDLKVRELGVEAEFLDDTGILSRSQFRVIL